MFIPFSDQPYPLVSWIIAAIAVVIIGIAKSGFGSGVGIAAVPLFVFAFGDASAAVGALLPILISADILSVKHHWGTWDKKNLKVLAPGTLLGLFLGIIALWWLSGMPQIRFIPAEWQFSPEPNQDRLDAAKRNMNMAIGSICVLYLLLVVVKEKYAPKFQLKADYFSGTIAGCAAGTVTAIAHAAGPVTTIYLLGQKLEKQKFIGTAVIYFFSVNSIKLFPYFLLGLINTNSLWAGLWLLPLVPLGTFLGVRLNQWMSDRVFKYTILSILFISGIQLLFNINAQRIGEWLN